MKPRILLSLAIVLLSSAAIGHPQESPKPERHGSSSAPANGTVAPDFTLKVVGGHGKSMRLSSLRGKAVLLNFWATWCGPCKIEMPWFVELQEKYGPQGLQVIGVAMDDAGVKAITAFARKMGVKYPILQGTEQVADLYGGLDGLPTTFFLDRSGKVVDQAFGLESESVMEDAIKKSLGSESRSTASAK